MDFLEIISGRYIIEVLGAFARYIYLNTAIFLMTMILFHFHKYGLQKEIPIKKMVTVI